MLSFKDCLQHNVLRAVFDKCYTTQVPLKPRLDWLLVDDGN